MGERKVLNKYYPPDFDPRLLPRNKRPKDQQITVRTMLPMNVQCTSCGEFMYAGKKFNSKKELAQGEDYLGIQVWRFYIKCTLCSSEVTFKTDPKNGNYIAERGCRRNFEPWREYDKNVEEAKKEREDEEQGDAMKALENRQIESKREMQSLEDLEELREISARQEKVDALAVLEARKRQIQLEAEKQAVQDEQEVVKIFADANGVRVKRTELDPDEEDEKNLESERSSIFDDLVKEKPKSRNQVLSKLKVVKRKANSLDSSSNAKRACTNPEALAALAAYASSSSEESE